VPGDHPDVVAEHVERGPDGLNGHDVGGAVRTKPPPVAPDPLLNPGFGLLEDADDLH